MDSQNDYLSKIERNANAVDHAPEEFRKRIVDDVISCRKMVKMMPTLNYEQRESVIKQINTILDDDYRLMGFKLESDGRTTIIK